MMGQLSLWDRPTGYGQPAIPLKPRQVAAHDAVKRALAGGMTRQLVALPTGVGKTIFAVHVSADFRRTLFLVHREELLDQTVAAYQEVWPGLAVGVWRGRQEPAGEPVVVSTIQTVYSRLSQLRRDAFNLVVIDESHHASAKTWRAVADHLSTDLRLGLSATPERSDGVPLSNLFDDVVYQMTVAEAITEGYLCRPKGLQVRTGKSLDGIKTRAGDFAQNQLADTVDTPERNALVAAAYVRHAAGRRAVAFAVTIEHAQHLAVALRQAGVNATWVSGDDPDRAEKIAALRSGQCEALCCAMLLTEGFDDPGIGCVLMAKPTQSRVLYTQAVGRGLRLKPQGLPYDDCILIDFVDASAKHRLVGAWDFIGRKIRPGKASAGSDAPADLLTSGLTEEELRILGDAPERCEQILGFVLDIDQWTAQVDLLDPAPLVPEAPTYGSRHWHYDSATPKQLDLLQRLGFDVVNTDWTKGQASKAIDSAPPSEKALKLLFAMGFDTLRREWTRAEVSKAFETAEREGRKPDWSRINGLRGGRR